MLSAKGHFVCSVQRKADLLYSCAPVNSCDTLRFYFYHVGPVITSSLSDLTGTFKRHEG